MQWRIQRGGGGATGACPPPPPKIGSTMFFLIQFSISEGSDCTREQNNPRASRAFKRALDPCRKWVCFRARNNILRPPPPNENPGSAPATDNFYLLPKICMNFFVKILMLFQIIIALSRILFCTRVWVLKAIWNGVLKKRRLLLRKFYSLYKNNLWHSFIL